ncbi:MAG: hypothetical protein KAI84_20840, partial [Gammaproteobacteria bacterium]|nr:hypothetical protein [Gammaproteobacteria bacterium]
ATRGSSTGKGAAYTDNSGGSISGRSGGTYATTDSNSAGGSDSSRFWLFAIIAALGALFFFFSKDMLSSLFKKNGKKGNRSRNAKAMNLFMKYSD